MTRFSLVVAYFPLFLLLSCFSVGADDLSELRANFESAYSRTIKPVTELNHSYAEALDRLFEKASEDGNLDAALRIKNEREKFGDGKEFDNETFESRATDVGELESLRETYLASREKRLSNLRKPIESLVEKYKAALSDIEQREMRNRDLAKALLAREQKEELSRDPRFSQVKTSRSAQVHIVAKGEVKLRLNSDPLSFRDKSRNDQYIDSITRSENMKPGDILFVEIMANAVYRSMIIAIESEDQSRVVPFGVDDFYFLGENPNTKDLVETELRKVGGRPTPGSPDGNMQALWTDHRLAPVEKAQCEWVLVAENGKWLTYAVIVPPSILEP